MDYHAVTDKKGGKTVPLWEGYGVHLGPASTTILVSQASAGGVYVENAACGTEVAKKRERARERNNVNGGIRQNSWNVLGFRQ